MDVANLREAYDRFIDSIRSGGFGPAPTGEWSAELVLAHLIVVNRLVAQGAAQVLASGEPRLDNRVSQSVPYLEAIVEVAGSWDSLVEEMRRSGEELIAVARRMTDEQAATVVSAYIVDGERVVVDGPVPIGQLVAVPAIVHLPGHANDLARLRAAE